MALQLAGSRLSITVPGQAGPTTPVTIGCEPSATPAGPPDPREIDLRVQKAIDEVLEYHQTHRPKNTSKNYLPKQKEWMVSAQLSGGNSLYTDYTDYLLCYRTGVRR